MYFPRHAKKDCVLIQDAFRLNGLTKLHEKQDGGKNALKERKNAKRKNNSYRMLPAPETATNTLPNHHQEQPTEKALLLPTAKHCHSATDAPQSARKGATGIILYMAKQGAEKRFYEPHREEKIT